jgi:hypothetical protein
MRPNEATRTRDPMQLRGRLRWRWRRFVAARRHGPRALAVSPIVFGNAIPKSGSKLLFNILLGLPRLGPFVDTGLNEIKPFRDGRPTPQDWIDSQLRALRPGDIRLGYLGWTPATEAHLCGARRAVYQIIRDPRDTIISQIFYATDMHAGHALRDYLRSLPDMEARIDVMIRGVPEGALQRVDIRTHFERYLPWMHHPQVCLVRYEDLTGGPEAELGRMLGYLRERGFSTPQPDSELVPRLREGMAPQRSETFRKGGAGGWREYFTSHNRAVFDQVAGDLLEALGYAA